MSDDEPRWLSYPSLEDAVKAWHDADTDEPYTTWLGLTPEQYHLLLDYPGVFDVLRKNLAERAPVSEAFDDVADDIAIAGIIRERGDYDGPWLTVEELAEAVGVDINKLSDAERRDCPCPCECCRESNCPDFNSEEPVCGCGCECCGGDE